MLRSVLVASTLFLGSFIPQVASACTITCSGGSCTGSYSCECNTNGTPKCKDSAGGGGCLVSEPACFESATVNSQELLRRVESQLGDQLAVSELRRALEEGQQAQAKGDKAAMEAARLRATTAVQSLSPEEQALVGQLIGTFMPNNEG